MDRGQTGQLAVALRARVCIFANNAQSWKLEKCKFAQSSVTFVGHTIGSGLHGPDPHKIACGQDMKPPNSKKEVRQILGFFSYFRAYIDRFAEIAKPLTDLTRKQVSSKISWTYVH